MSVRSADEASSTGTPTRGLFREVLAVLLLTIGSILPVIPWLVGVALLWTSDRWRVGEKLLGTLVWPLGYAPVLVLATVPVSSEGCASTQSGNGPVVQHCTSSGMDPSLGQAILFVLVVAPLVVGSVLLVRASRRTRVERAGVPAPG